MNEQFRARYFDDEMIYGGNLKEPERKETKENTTHILEITQFMESTCINCINCIASTARTLEVLEEDSVDGIKVPGDRELDFNCIQRNVHKQCTPSLLTLTRHHAHPYSIYIED